MNEALGLLDSLEATILEGKKIPLTDRVVLEEKEILSLIDKLRLTLKSNGGVVREALKSGPRPTIAVQESASPQILKDALKKAERIKAGAQEYADQTLSNLQLMITKSQKGLLVLEQNIEKGREVLEGLRKEKGDQDESKE
jgi:hypothetical protein